MYFFFVHPLLSVRKGGMWMFDFPILYAKSISLQMELGIYNEMMMEIEINIIVANAKT